MHRPGNKLDMLCQLEPRSLAALGQLLALVYFQLRLTTSYNSPLRGIMFAFIYTHFFWFVVFFPFFLSLFLFIFFKDTDSSLIHWTLSGSFLIFHEGNFMAKKEKINEDASLKTTLNM